MRLVPLLACCLIACGDDGIRHTPDATPHDGPVTHDAPADVLQLDPVTITVTQGQPVAGVRVYFQNADSSVVLATMTDATGTASAMMVAGGYVTAVNPFGAIEGTDEVDTIAGVKPGDHLVLNAVPTATSINVTVQVPQDPAASSTTVYTPCSQPTAVNPPAAIVASGSVTLTGCGGTTDFLVVTFDQSGTALNTFYAPGQAISDGATIDLTAQTYTGVLTRTYTMNNVPALRNTNISDYLLDAQGVVWQGSTFTQSDQQSPEAGLPVPAFANAKDVVVTSLSQGSSQHTLVDWGPYTSAYAPDVGSRVLPFFTNNPMLDRTTNTASITEDTSGQTPDLMILGIGANRTSAGRSWNWNLAAPHATSIAYPTLPTDVFNFNFQPSDTSFFYRWTNAKVPGGWDAARAVVLSFNTPTDFALMGSGQAELEDGQIGFTGRVASGRVTWRTEATQRVLAHRVR